MDFREMAWHAARIELGRFLEALASIVGTLTATDLEPMVGTARDAAVLQHNAYHAGQIALLAGAIRDQVQDPIVSTEETS